MKKRAFIWGILAFAFLFLFPFPVSAGVLDVVDLTAEQTLALYGNTIPARYYANGTWYDCNFSYFGKSSDMVSGYTTYISRYQFTDSNSEYKQQMLEDSVFLFYRCPVSSLSETPDNTANMMFDLHFTIDLRGIAYFRQIFGCGVSSAAYDSYTAKPVSGGTSFSMASNVSYSPLTNVITAGKNTTTVGGVSYVSSLFNTIVSKKNSFAQDIIVHDESKFAFGDIYLENLVEGLQESFSISSQQFYCSKMVSSILPDDVLNPTNNPLDYTTYYVICLMCPRVTEGYIFPDDPGSDIPDYSGQLDDIHISVNESNSILQDILDKLDLIYQKQYSVTVNVDSSGIVSGIVDGIKGLFVPTQTDLLNFRLGMSTLVSDTFAPFEDAEAVRDLAVQRIMSVSPTATLDLPLMDLRPTVDFYIPPDSFTSQGYQVVDGKVKVPLKPNEEDWGFFYDLLKWAIDVICTTAFVNMLLNKFGGLIVGKKVVELEDDC